MRTSVIFIDILNFDLGNSTQYGNSKKSASIDEFSNSINANGNYIWTPSNITNLYFKQSYLPLTNVQYIRIRARAKNLKGDEENQLLQY